MQGNVHGGKNSSLEIHSDSH